MAELESLQAGVKVKGILPQQEVSVVDVQWHGSTAVELFYKRPDGQPGTQLLFRSDEANLQIVQPERTWRFHADGDLFRLVAREVWSRINPVTARIGGMPLFDCAHKVCEVMRGTLDDRGKAGLQG